MEVEKLNFDFGKITDQTFKDIKNERKEESINLKPEMFDYVIGKSSLRYEWILSLENKEEKLYEMTKLITEILPVGFPDEFYDWYSRECMGLQYTKYELRDMKRKYKIQKKRELEKKKKEDKKLKFIKKNIILEF
tara:strand:+ start:624 stop:1028 length:405 start_codon:yes stop_codon:yes gene_type:complete